MAQATSDNEGNHDDMTSADDANCQHVWRFRMQMSVPDLTDIADINNTILHCLGIDNARLSVKFQSLDARITGVEEYRLLTEFLA